MMAMSCASMRNQAFRGKFHHVSSAMRASSGLSRLCSTPSSGGICAACNLTLDREGVVKTTAAREVLHRRGLSSSPVPFRD